MIKNRKNYFFHLILFFLILQPALKIKANESQKFLTLKNDEVNLRQGPSFNYPIKLTYKKNIFQLLLLINLKPGDKSKILKKTQVGFIFPNFQKENLELI